ncbi:MAG: DUF5672 family protein [Terrimicrobiaceae bacterium]
MASESPSQVKSAAVVVPLHRLPLTEDEEVSLRVLRKVLGKHPRFFVVPSGMAVPAEFLQGESVVRFPARYFTYPYGYNRLLMSACFYNGFRRFSHMLVYQLDCLVFRDELDLWCSRNYDYIGAPWLENAAGKPGDGREWKVGNGGFSLRKVSTARAVLAKRVKRGSLFPIPPIHLPGPDFSGWLITNCRKRIKQHLGLWTVAEELDNYGENEDRFWALDVLRIAKEYAKPPVDEALRFAFEVEPRLCFERTQGLLPFGCHAWAKHDRAFWETVPQDVT